MLSMAVGRRQQCAGRWCFWHNGSKKAGIRNLALIMTETIAPNSNEVYFLNNKEYPVILWILLNHYM